ncbi:carbohydrate-binding protein SusD [Niastella yeongjuensis]|uniref:Carbohydrate-binding protein SusD n=1 Tax=Niastella yeongjuensis TaxID=354355 RepID=A0A1V9EAP7_9BACT|nr:RagB/SusD family nutrient uptake outer membrane protein [Niastella yeongjuensis]OQP43190.1 carbohydrate-binding protein SusD [Niastella yeongjuensis]SEO51357.1 Starch-binding associating with outer membrane [Niastella yeongjuensis]
MKTANRYFAFYITLPFVLAGLITSCKKQLDLEPQSAFDEQYVFSNVTNATAALVGVYNELAGDFGYGSRLSTFYPYDTDEMLGILNTSTPDNSSRDLSRYNLQSTNAQLEGPFNQLYAGIERANICIKNIPNMDLYKNGTASEVMQLQRLYGEALTLRAQFYFELIRNWGDVPALFDPAIDQPDLFLAKADRDSIYNHVLDDLKLAATLLPWRNEAGATNDERITKGAAKALRARIALFAGGYSLRRPSNQMQRRDDYLTYYQVAKDECNDIMQRRDAHTLNPSFKAVFKDAIDAHKTDPYGEVIFEVAMAGGNGVSDSKIGYYDGPRFYVPGNSTLLGNGQIRVVPTYFYAFDSLDTRRDVTNAPYYNAADATKTVQTMINMTSGKFRADWITNPAPSSAVQYLGVNWPLIRFADVLLMFAEADNELSNGPTPAAIAAFEEVRKRGFAGNANKIGVTPAQKEAFFNAIVNERSFELGGEGIRKYDLIRWNLINQKILDTRAALTKMLNKTAPYDKLPQSMFYKSKCPDVIWSSSLYQPAASATPSGYTKIAWISSITAAYITNVAQLFKPNHSELLPIPQPSIDANPNITQDYGY